MSARLIALNKKGNGVRPIAIGEAFARLVAKVAMMGVQKKVTGHFGDLQLGVGVPNSAEAIVHGVNRFLGQKDYLDGKVLLKVDLTNAFNQIDRTSVFEQVALVCPEILECVQQMYGGHPLLFYGKSNIIESQIGVRQGCPLGSLLFCLALHKIITSIKEDPISSELDINTWYIDDGTLIGSSEAVLRALEILSTEGPAIGVHVNLSKCELLALSSTSDLTDFPAQISREEGGVELLGAFVGGIQELTDAYVNSRVDKIEEIVSKLDSLKNLQAKYIILRQCALYAKFNFPMRVTHPSLYPTAKLRYDMILRESISSLASYRPINPWTMERMNLPVNYSGMGIVTAANICWPAYLGSQIDSITIQSQILKTDIQSIAAPIEVLTTEFLEYSGSALPFDSLLGSKSTQSRLSDIIHKATYDRLLSSAPSPRDANIMLTLSMPHSSDWLSALPREDRRFTTQDWLFCFFYRNGIPLSNRESNCRCCGGILDIYGEHSAGCGTGFGSDTTSRKNSAPRGKRHKKIKDVIIHDARKGGMYPSLREPRGLIDQAPTLRPADIYFENLFGSQSLAIDVTIIKSLGYSQTNAPFCPRSVLIDKENSKNAMYRNLCESNGILFKPFVMGSLGGFGEECHYLVKKIAQAQFNMNFSSYSVSELMNFLYQRLSYFVQVCQAEAFAERQPLYFDYSD
jgi:hypothetical protein